MYKEFKQLNLPEIDKQVLAFWDQQEIFRRSVEERDPSNSFVFYEGPPSANGKPGIHHVIARTIKDLFCRYHTMLGKRVERKGGWDTHGLPIELSVEKELGITKEDIGKSISVDEYNQKCRETVMRYKDMWDDITRKMGYWVDLDDPYITYKNEYIETVWWLLKQLYDKGLIYKGYTIQPYSPAAGTGLSSHELNMPGAYREVTDTTVVAMFPTERNAEAEWLYTLPVQPPAADGAATILGSADSEQVYILAWTTTPWTLPSNTALTVGPKIQYVKVRTNNPYTDEEIDVVLAADLVDKWFGDKRQPQVTAISAPFSGDQLVGLRYQQILPVSRPEEGDAFRVIPGDFVTTEDGTGIVHTAPSFGADDMRVGKANGIGALTLVDKTGRFTEGAGPFAGRFVKNYQDEADFVDVNIDIAVHLKKAGLAFNVAKYNHNYPHCWRTDKPVLYYPLDSWFIKASAVRERMYELNQTINWKPASTGEGRFGKWLENLQDWNLSRSRYWGIPLPIWRSADGSEALCVGSIEELRQHIALANEKLGLEQEVPADLHRPYIDEVVLWQNGQELRRELDLIDVWFDSGSMPYAQWHYPFENQERFKNNFPADFIAEGVDQTRGWFYTLHAIATMVFDSVAFKNVVSNGLVLDKEGHKMSKRLGNAVDPFETIATYGADATRWYMIANSDPWDNLKFDLEGVAEVQRRFFGTLYNTYSFFALYANIDEFRVGDRPAVPASELPEIDRWIVSKLNSLVREVRGYYSDYEPTKACRAIDTFVNDHLSNWYVRQSRRRFWRGDMTTDKQAAYETLYQCLVTVAQLMAPVAPFFAEWLYDNLRTEDDAVSVHLSLLAEVDEAAIDRDLEERMDYAQRLSSLVLSLRKREKARVRQPLQKILVPVLDEDFQRKVNAVRDIILGEVNVKELAYLTDEDTFLKKRIKPNYKTLGRRLGKQMKAAAAAIDAMSQADIAALEQSGSYTLHLDGEDYELSLEDFEISTEDIPGWKVATDGELTVALDVNITPELAAEGMARELVNRIQNIRKDKDFNVTDRIEVTIEDVAPVRPALEQFGDYIRQEVLADSLDLSADLNGAAEELELPGDVRVKVSVSRVS
jgi:isoleucyl-tRNA synthetase